VLSDTSAVSDVVVVTMEPFYRALDRAGLEPRQIFEAANTLIDSTGSASASVRRSETFELAPDLLARVRALPADKAPTLTRIVGGLGAEGLAYDFDSGSSPDCPP